jgi:hypothetical protein
MDTPPGFQKSGFGLIWSDSPGSPASAAIKPDFQTLQNPESAQPPVDYFQPPKFHTSPPRRSLFGLIQFDPPRSASLNVPQPPSHGYAIGFQINQVSFDPLGFARIRPRPRVSDPRAEGPPSERTCLRMEWNDIACLLAARRGSAAALSILQHRQPRNNAHTPRFAVSPSPRLPTIPASTLIRFDPA